MSDSATMEAEVAATVGSPVKKVEKVDVTPSKTEPALNGDSKDSTANGKETPKTPKKEDEK